MKNGSGHMIIKEMSHIPMKLKSELARASMTTSDVNNQWCRHFTVMLEINDNMFVSHLWVDKCVSRSKEIKSSIKNHQTLMGGDVYLMQSCVTKFLTNLQRCSDYLRIFCFFYQFNLLPYDITKILLRK